MVEQIGDALRTGQDRVALAATGKDMNVTPQQKLQEAKEGREKIQAGMEKFSASSYVQIFEKLEFIATLPEKLRGEALLMMIPRELSLTGELHESEIRAMEMAVKALPEHMRPAGLAEAVDNLRDSALERGARSAEEIIAAVIRMRSEKNPSNVLKGMNASNSEIGTRNMLKRGFDNHGRRNSADAEPWSIGVLRTSPQSGHQALIARYDRTINAEPRPAGNRSGQRFHESEANPPASAAELLKDAPGVIAAFERLKRDRGLIGERAADGIGIRPKTFNYLMNSNGMLRSEEELQALAASLKPFQVAGFQEMIEAVQRRLGKPAPVSQRDPVPAQSSRVKLADASDASDGLARTSTPSASDVVAGSSPRTGPPAVPPLAGGRKGKRKMPD